MDKLYSRESLRKDAETFYNKIYTDMYDILKNLNPLSEHYKYIYNDFKERILRLNSYYRESQRSFSKTKILQCTEAMQLCYDSFRYKALKMRVLDL